MRFTRPFSFAALIVASLTLSPQTAQADFSARVASVSANPNPVSAGQTVSLTASIQNTSSVDSGYQGSATFVPKIKVATPGGGTSACSYPSQEWQPYETKAFACNHTSSSSEIGTNTVTVEVWSPSLDRLWTSRSFSYRVNSPDPCANVTCSKFCDGNVRVLGQTCSNGQCTGGSRVDCDTLDASVTSYFCSGNDVWVRRQSDDYSCHSGTCTNQPSTSTAPFKSCSAGCDSTTNDCKPDPCAGKTCLDTCDGDTRLTGGFCFNENGTATCAYMYMRDCHDFDSGVSEMYCELNDAYAHTRQTTYTCSAGQCAGSTSYANRQFINTCGNTCDGNVRVLGQSCSSGQCVGGFRLDCDTFDQSTSTHFCNGNEVWIRQQKEDYACASGACVDHPSESTSGFKSCGFGCDPLTADCKSDPCAGIACPDTCEGNTFKSGGSCVPNEGVGTCVYPRQTDCSAQDTRESRTNYCRGNDVHSHQLTTTFSCTTGGCSPKVSWTNDQPETSCDASVCEGNVSVISRTCVDGTCMDLLRADCAAQATTPAAVNYCSGTQLRTHDVHMEFSCVPMLGMCGDGQEITENDRLVEDCATRAAVDTITSRYCNDRDHPATTHLVTPWTCGNGACMAGTSFTKTVDENICASSERCETIEGAPGYGTCVPCVSSWMCQDWSACAGQPAQTRNCYDVFACTTPMNRPDETRDCPCEITSIRWEDENGNEKTAAKDSDPVVIDVRHRGSCANVQAPLEIWNENWAVIPDDGPGVNSRFRIPDFSLGNDGTQTLQSWIAAYYPTERWGDSRLYVKVPSYRDFRSEHLLNVQATEGTFGVPLALMEQNPPNPLTSADDRECLLEPVSRVVVTDHCLELWKRGGAFIRMKTRHAEESLQTVLEFFIGKTTGAFVYLLTCALCPSATAAAGALCPETGVACLALPAAVACDIGCLGPVGRFVGRIIGWLWESALVRWATEELLPFVRNGFEEVAVPTSNNLREDLVHKMARKPDGSTVDLFMEPDPHGPTTIVIEETRDALIHHAGYGDFVGLNTELRTQYSEAGNLFNLDDDVFGNQLASAEMKLAGTVFSDSAVKERLGPYLHDLTGTMDANPYHFVKEIRLVPRTVRGNSVSSYGRTVFDDEGNLVVELALRDTLDSFRERAAQMLRSFTLPHELGHAAAAQQAARLRAALNTVGNSVVPAIEYLNDVYVLRHLRPELASEFAELKGLQMVKTFLAADGTLTQTGETFVSNFVYAATHNAPRGASAYELARIRALLDTFGAGPVTSDTKVKLAQIAARLDEKLQTAFVDAGGTSAEQEQMIEAFADLRSKLAADGETYASHLMDSRWDDQNGMMNILCESGYGYIKCPQGSSSFSETGVEDGLFVGTEKAGLRPASVPVSVGPVHVSPGNEVSNDGCAQEPASFLSVMLAALLLRRRR